MVWEHRTPTAVKTTFEVITFCVVSVLLAAKIVFGIYAWFAESPNALGFEESLHEAFDRYYPTKIAPPKWNYGIWTLIFVCQAGWIAHAWSFMLRLTKPRTIYPGSHLAFIAVCCSAIGWLYSWTNMKLEVSMALIGLMVVCLIAGFAMVVIHLYRITSTLKYFQNRDLFVTKVLSVNGLMLYLAWAFLNMLLTLGSLLIDNADVHPKTTVTIVLSLMAGLTVSYFVLENTILDRFLRYSIMAYPVVLWYMVGVVAENWESIQNDSNDRNNICIIAFTVVAVALCALRIFLLVLYRYFRPIPEYEESLEDLIPQ